MKPVCAMCGRPTTPAVMIGNEAIGPRCARKAGFFAKPVKGSRIRILPRKVGTPRQPVPQTLDLFEGLDE